MHPIKTVYYAVLALLLLLPTTVSADPITFTNTCQIKEGYSYGPNITDALANSTAAVTQACRFISTSPNFAMVAATKGVNFLTSFTEAYSNYCATNSLYCNYIYRVHWQATCCGTSL